MSTSDDRWQSAVDLVHTEGNPERAAATGRAGSDVIGQRLQSLDAYRGLIMISLAFAGFGLAQTADNHLQLAPDWPIWQQIKFNFTHVQWVGCGYWDLIQPSFMFMVGVSMAYSYAKRRSLGHSPLRMLLHAMWRSLVLIFLGIFLISNWSSSTNWSFMNVLTQIGLGYTFLFLLWGRSFRTQSEAAIVLLVATWAGYFFFPQAGIDLKTGVPIYAVEGETEVGVAAEWAQQNLAGVGRPWHKNANLGQFVDKHWILKQLPNKEPYRYSAGGYQTINFIPSLVTMLFGLMCGELLRSHRMASYKLLALLIGGALGLGLGYALDASGFCPLVKRIWTPSWTLYSTGACCLILALLYAVIDVAGFRFWAYPLRVVGANSIAIYCMSQLLRPWTRDTLETHFGDKVFQLKLKWGEAYYRLMFIDERQDQLIELYEPTIQAVLVGLVFWLVCFWMYRNRIFVRI